MSEDNGTKPVVKQLATLLISGVSVVIVVGGLVYGLGVNMQRITHVEDDVDEHVNEPKHDGAMLKTDIDSRFQRVERDIDKVDAKVDRNLHAINEVLREVKKP